MQPALWLEQGWIEDPPPPYCSRTCPHQDVLLGSSCPLQAAPPTSLRSAVTVHVRCVSGQYRYIVPSALQGSHSVPPRQRRLPPPPPPHLLRHVRRKPGHKVGPGPHILRRDATRVLPEVCRLLLDSRGHLDGKLVGREEAVNWVADVGEHGHILRQHGHHAVIVVAGEEVAIGDRHIDTQVVCGEEEGEDVRGIMRSWEGAYSGVRSINGGKWRGGIRERGANGQGS